MLKTIHKKRIIESLLDTDLYKLTMQQAVFHQHPNVNVEYTFKNRTDGINLLPLKDHIEEQIGKMCEYVHFSNEDIAYLSQLPFMSQNYLDLLRMFRLNKKHVHMYEEDGDLAINIKGGWLYTILFETPILAIVSETYFDNEFPEIDMDDGLTRLNDKIDMIKEVPDLTLADFGTRRRRSRSWHKKVVAILAKNLPHQFIGTSNVLFAKKFGIKPIGTMAHEWIQAGQGIRDVRLSESQKYMLQSWVNEYRGKLGIALTDTIGIDAFLKDFDDYFAKLYDGVRHDSGDPFDFGDKVIEHYRQLGIDPKTKVIIFSDGLNIPKATEILEYFRGRIKVSFGIGTNLTNDFGDARALQIVMKMTKCNGEHVAKISDAQGKTMCKHYRYLHYLKDVFEKKPTLF